MDGLEVLRLVGTLTLEDDQFKGKLQQAEKDVASAADKMSGDLGKVSDAAKKSAEATAKAGESTDDFMADNVRKWEAAKRAMREEADEATKAAGDLGEGVKKGAEKAGTALGEFGKTLALVGAGLTAFATGPIVAAFTSLTRAGEKFADNAIRLREMSAAAGLSTDTIQTLGYVAAGAGSNVGTLTTAAFYMNRNLASATEEGNEAAEALRRLGIAAVDDATGGLRSMDELLPEVLAALADVEDTTDRAGLAWALFGRAARTMTPILSLSGDEMRRMAEEAAELGVVLDADVIDAAARTQGEMNQMRLVIQSAWQEVNVAFLPVMKRMADFMRDTVVPIARSVAERVAGITEAFVEAEGAAKVFGGVLVSTGPLLTGLGLLLMAVDKVIASLGRLKTAFLAFATGPQGVITAAVVGLALLGTKLHEIATRETTEAKTAVENVADALASGDRDSLVSALNAVIEVAQGDMRTALTELRQDLIQTGTVSEEQARRVMAAMASMRLEEVEQPFLSRWIPGLQNRMPLHTALESAGLELRQPDLITQMQRALGNQQYQDAYMLAVDAKNALIEAGWTDTIVAFRELSQYVDELRALVPPSGLDIDFTVPWWTPAEFQGGAGTTTPPPSTGKPPRTEKDVWDELAAYGLWSMGVRDKEIRAGIDEAEATVADLERRAAALEDAKAELLRDFYDELSDAELAYLNDRILWVTEEIRARLAEAIPLPGVTLEEAVAWAQANPDAFNLERPDLTGGVIAGYTRARVPIPGVMEPAWGTSEQGIANVPVDERHVLAYKEYAATRILADREARAVAAQLAAEEEAEFRERIGWHQQYVRSRMEGDRLVAEAEAAALQERIEWQEQYVWSRLESDRILAAEEEAAAAQRLADYDFGVELAREILKFQEMLADAARARAREEREVARAMRVQAYETERAVRWWQEFYDIMNAPPKGVGLAGEKKALAYADATRGGAEQNPYLTMLQRTPELWARTPTGDIMSGRLSDALRAGQGATGLRDWVPGAVGFMESVLSAVPVLGEALGALSFTTDKDTGEVSASFDWMQMLTDLIMRLVTASEPFAEFMEKIVTLLKPFAERLGEVAVDILTPLLDVGLQLLDVLWPVIESVVALVNVALQPLVWVLETIVVPVLDFFARVVVGLANVIITVINWFRRDKLPLLDPNQPSPRDDPRYNPPPTKDPAEIEDAWEEVVPQSFGGTPQAVQLAVATPLVEASWMMLDAATMMQDTFANLMPDLPDMGLAALPPFTSALDRMTPVLERLLSEGVSITTPGGSASGSSAQTAYLRGI